MKIKEIVEKIRKELRKLEEERQIAFKGVKELQEDTRLVDSYKNKLINEIIEKYLELATKTENELNTMITQEKEKNINAYKVLDIEIIREVQTIKDYINDLTYKLDIVELKHLLSKYKPTDKKGLYTLIQLKNFLYDKEEYKNDILELFNDVNTEIEEYNKYEKLKQIDLVKGINSGPNSLSLTLYLEYLEKQ